MKILGRIILLVVGGLMLFSAITGLIDCINQIKDIGGWQALLNSLKDASLRATTFQALTGILKSSGLIIVAASAVFAGLKGRGGFWFSIFSIVMLAMFIWDVVEKNKGGAFAGDKLWKAILQLVIDSATQLGYIAGFILLKLSKDK